MGRDMAEEPLPSGWLPPRAPAHPTSPEAPQRPMGEWPPPARDRPGQRPPSLPPPGPQPPSSPLAVAAIAVSSCAVVLLVVTAGVSYAISLVLGLIGFTLSRQAQRRAKLGQPMRPGQARAAVLASAIALGLAGVAALVWIVLAANGITPSDLQEALQREADRLRRG
jgi:hypothetical protein